MGRRVRRGPDWVAGSDWAMALRLRRQRAPRARRVIFRTIMALVAGTDTPLAAMALHLPIITLPNTRTRDTT